MGTEDKRQVNPGKTNLMAACEQGRTLDVKIILQKKPLLVASKDRNGKTALHYSAESGNLPCVQLLVSADSTLVTSQDSEGFTPLHIAVITGHRTIVKFLLKHGSDPNAADKERHSCIHWASVCGDVETLDILLNHGADPSTADILGAYPIHYAAQMCGPQSVVGKDTRIGIGVLRKLIRRGASIQCRDRDGREPLLWAASTGSCEAVLLLFSSGANIMAADKDGLTALHCAASRGHTSCVETLVTLCGAKANGGDALGCSPLFYSAAQGHADATHTLLKYGADPNLQDNKGRTAAHCAAGKGQWEAMRILDSNGGDLWIRNTRGNLPLHEAVQSGRKDLVQWLLQQNPSAVNATNMNGRTPLHITGQNNNVEMCEVLIEHGAFINPLMVNDKGFFMTPLDITVHQGNQRCAKFIHLHGGIPATKVLENTEIDRNLLFSLGNYACSQKDRSDEDGISMSSFENIPRPAPTVTITKSQKVPQRTEPLASEIPITPSESLLTNVTSEDPADASVHIHLTTDDLWTMWESLMQGFATETASGDMSSTSPLRTKVLNDNDRRQPAVTSVYLRKISNVPNGVEYSDANERNVQLVNRSGAIVTEKKGEVTEYVVANIIGSREREVPKEDWAQKESQKLDKLEGEERCSSHVTYSSHVSGMDSDSRLMDRRLKNTSNELCVSDSVGSDTEDIRESKAPKLIKLRKKKSDTRTGGRTVDESETSSGHKTEERIRYPYLKRANQKKHPPKVNDQYVRLPELEDHAERPKEEEFQQLQGVGRIPEIQQEIQNPDQFDKNTENLAFIQTADKTPRQSEIGMSSFPPVQDQEGGSHVFKGERGLIEKGSRHKKSPRRQSMPEKHEKMGLSERRRRNTQGDLNITRDFLGTNRLGGTDASTMETDMTGNDSAQLADDHGYHHFHHHHHHHHHHHDIDSNRLENLRTISPIIMREHDKLPDHFDRHAHYSKPHRRRRSTFEKTKGSSSHHGRSKHVSDGEILLSRGKFERSMFLRSRSLTSMQSCESLDEMHSDKRKEPYGEFEESAIEKSEDKTEILDESLAQKSDREEVTLEDQISSDDDDDGKSQTIGEPMDLKTEYKPVTEEEEEEEEEETESLKNNMVETQVESEKMENGESKPQTPQPYENYDFEKDIKSDLPEDSKELHFERKVDDISKNADNVATFEIESDISDSIKADSSQLASKEPDKSPMIIIEEYPKDIESDSAESEYSDKGDVEQSLSKQVVDDKSQESTTKALESKTDDSSTEIRKQENDTSRKVEHALPAEVKDDKSISLEIKADTPSIKINGEEKDSDKEDSGFELPIEIDDIESKKNGFGKDTESVLSNGFNGYEQKKVDDSESDVQIELPEKVDDKGEEKDDSESDVQIELPEKVDDKGGEKDDSERDVKIILTEKADDDEQGKDDDSERDAKTVSPRKLDGNEEEKEDDSEKDALLPVGIDDNEQMEESDSKKDVDVILPAGIDDTEQRKGDDAKNDIDVTSPARIDNNEKGKEDDTKNDIDVTSPAGIDNNEKGKEDDTKKDIDVILPAGFDDELKKDDVKKDTEISFPAKVDDNELQTHDSNYEAETILPNDEEGKSISKELESLSDTQGIETTDLEKKHQHKNDNGKETSQANTEMEIDLIPVKSNAFEEEHVASDDRKEQEQTEENKEIQLTHIKGDNEPIDENGEEVRVCLSPSNKRSNGEEEKVTMAKAVSENGTGSLDKNDGASPATENVKQETDAEENRETISAEATFVDSDAAKKGEAMVPEEEEDETISTNHDIKITVQDTTKEGLNNLELTTNITEKSIEPGDTEKSVKEVESLKRDHDKEMSVTEELATEPPDTKEHGMVREKTFITGKFNPEESKASTTILHKENVEKPQHIKQTQKEQSELFPKTITQEKGENPGKQMKDKSISQISQVQAPFNTKPVQLRSIGTQVSEKPKVHGSRTSQTKVERSKLHKSERSTTRSTDRNSLQVHFKESTTRSSRTREKHSQTKFRLEESSASQESIHKTQMIRTLKPEVRETSYPKPVVKLPKPIQIRSSRRSDLKEVRKHQSIGIQTEGRSRSKHNLRTQESDKMTTADTEPSVDDLSYSSQRRKSKKNNLGAIFFIDKDSEDEEDENRTPRMHPKKSDNPFENYEFHKLNEKGELTLFCSSMNGNPPSQAQTAHFSTSHTSNLTRPRKQRQPQSNLDKPGFLWVHFGSNSSPMHTPKKKPMLTSESKVSKEPVSPSRDPAKSSRFPSKDTSPQRQRYPIRKTQPSSRPSPKQSPIRTRSKPAPTKVAPRPSPVKTAPKLSPVKTAPKPSPVKVAPKPSPVKVAPKPSPVKVAPKPSPVKVAPKPSPVKVAPKPSPVKVAPKPSPVKTVPKKSPIRTAPKPSPVKTISKAPPSKTSSRPSPTKPKPLPAKTTSKQSSRTSQLDSRATSSVISATVGRKDPKLTSRKPQAASQIKKEEEGETKSSSKHDQQYKDLITQSQYTSNENLEVFSTTRVRRKSSSAIKDLRMTEESIEDLGKLSSTRTRRKSSSELKDLILAKQSIENVQELLNEDFRKISNAIEKYQLERESRERTESFEKIEAMIMNGSCSTAGSDAIHMRDYTVEDEEMEKHLSRLSGESDLLYNEEEKVGEAESHMEEKGSVTEHGGSQKASQSQERRLSSSIQDNKSSAGRRPSSHRQEAVASSSESHPKDRDNKNKSTAGSSKSTSTEEGDLKLVIERKTDPEFSIRIKVPDPKKKDKTNKDHQSESEISLKDSSGYVSAVESIYNNRRNFTIDVGHTTAKINTKLRRRETTTSSDTPGKVLDANSDEVESSSTTRKTKTVRSGSQNILEEITDVRHHPLYNGRCNRELTVVNLARLEYFQSQESQESVTISSQPLTTQDRAEIVSSESSKLPLLETSTTRQNLSTTKGPALSRQCSIVGQDLESEKGSSKSSSPKDSHTSEKEFDTISSAPKESRPSEKGFSKSSSPRESRPSQKESSKASSPRESRPSQKESSKGSSPRESRPSEKGFSKSSSPRESRPSEKESSKASLPKESRSSEKESSNASLTKESRSSEKRSSKTSSPRKSLPSEKESSKTSSPRKSLLSEKESSKTSSPRKSLPSEKESSKAPSPRKPRLSEMKSSKGSSPRESRFSEKGSSKTSSPRDPRLSEKGSSKASSPGESRLSEKGSSKASSREESRLSEKGSSKASSHEESRLSEKGSSKASSREESRLSEKGSSKASSPGESRLSEKGSSKATSPGESRLSEKGSSKASSPEESHLSEKGSSKASSPEKSRQYEERQETSLQGKRKTSGIPISRTHSDGNIRPQVKLRPGEEAKSQSMLSLKEEDVNTNRIVKSSPEVTISAKTRLPSPRSETNRKVSSLPTIFLPATEEMARLSTAGSISIFSDRLPPMTATESFTSSREKQGQLKQSYLKLPLLQQPVRCRCVIHPHRFLDTRRTRSAIDGIANIHFLSEEELAIFGNQELYKSPRISHSCDKFERCDHPFQYKALRTQTLKRLRKGRGIHDPRNAITFHVDHQKERNTFKLPTDQLQDNKKLQVVFTIGKTGADQQDSSKT